MFNPHCVTEQGDGQVDFQDDGEDSVQHRERKGNHISPVSCGVQDDVVVEQGVDSRLLLYEP